jgi:hypothetical protein
MIKRPLFVVLVCLFQVSAVLFPNAVHAQAGFGDDRVMLQGFYWESHRHGHLDRFPSLGSKNWYEIVRDVATELRDARFDLAWLPPPSYAGDISAGYNPKEYFNLNSTYGDFNSHRAMLVALLGNGVEPVADIVINHRDATRGWAGFENPSWGTDFQQNARSSGVYAARVVGSHGNLYVRIGGDDSRWQPSFSNYRNYREYAQGAGWKVWVGLPGNPPFQQAPLKGPLPLPDYRAPDTIDVPDSSLN